MGRRLRSTSAATRVIFSGRTASRVEYLCERCECPLAWYLDETFSVSARAWQDRLLRGSITLMVPSLHYWEFANVLRTLVHRHEITPSLAREIYDLHIDAPLEKAEPDERKVLDVALQYHATAYDAVYLVLCIARELTLITAEKTTTPWVAKFRDRVEFVK